FSLIVLGLTSTLPGALTRGLTQQGVPNQVASGIATLPPVELLFAAFLGYNPMSTLLGSASGTIPAHNLAVLTGHSFFPNLIAQPFVSGMHLTFGFATVMMLIAAVASWFRGKRYVYGEAPATAQPSAPEGGNAQQRSAAGSVSAD
ncbi:MAG: MFS transporter, partial [Candidatus Dormiibacterota bacterium]